jgi:tetratricopeptide (TPR) repeat protein
MRTMTGKTKPGKPGPRSGRDLLGQAQETIYDAWEIADPIKRAAMAKKALKLSPDCADAYVILAQAARTPAKALEFYRKGVAAGARALGRQTFEDDAGHFWGLFETRPYMRARARWAQALWEAGQYDEALVGWHDMLELNPNDNQGIRYVLAARLLEGGRDRELAVLLKQHQDDSHAYLIWTNALLLFRTHGDNSKSRRALVDALASNPHVPTYLLGHKPIPHELPDYTGFGDETEAMCLAADNLKAWKSTKGALAWLAQSIVPPKPTLLN